MATRKASAAISVLAVAVCAALALSGCIGIWPSGLRPHTDDSYTLGGAELMDVPTSLDIDWTSGCVTIEYHDGPMLAFYEKCPTGSLEELPQMAWKVDGDTLYIEFVQPGVRYWGPEKELTVLVPSGYVFRKVNVHATGADIDVPLLEAEKLHLYSTSGTVEATLTANDLSVRTTSGDMRVTQTGRAEKVAVESTSGGIFLAQLGKAVDVTAETTSGSIRIEVTECASVKAESTSGAIEVAIPEGWGFTGRLSTASGSLISDIRQLTKQGKTYKYGDGSHSLDASTTSGNVYLKLK